ncbi:MAG TPA: hypothetical protein DHV15_00740 [Treponema sp.]|uniref:Uncharacterized protein n=1 Tax=Treponema denticola (strain ATCC 35405 / DSM 14222 / CIP 103919 / JCM 8153 / KCTC 15104) TaxID=243275 RepID=Q73P80_TREDE|nr:hypothetical protein TDE_0919 [Treponema denticola ATCC 35405]HCY94028.1 hypothetical protein [Treponema sp.]
MYNEPNYKWLESYKIYKQRCEDRTGMYYTEET